MNVFIYLIMFLAGSALAKDLSSPNRPDRIPGEFIVKIRENSSLLNFRKGIDAQSLSENLNVNIKESIEGMNLILVRNIGPRIDTQFAERIKENSNVEYIEPNYLFYSRSIVNISTESPNDPDFFQQWGLYNNGQKSQIGIGGTPGIDIKAREAWELETGSKKIIVAVIDSGINFLHPDLKDNLWTNSVEANGKPGVDDDQNGFVDDIYGYNFANNVGSPFDDYSHGTRCAGVIGAKGNNQVGISGINWDVSIMSLKFITQKLEGSLFDAVKAINYAVQMKANIISASWGGKNKTNSLAEAIERANEAGILFVTAAGNEWENNDQTPTYPATYDIKNIIAVGSINNRGQLSSFSNYGRKKVHVVAPGEGILSTGTSEYMYSDGTSLATPFVAGVAALVLAHEPKLSMTDLRDRLLTTAEPVIGAYQNTVSGGMINAFNALAHRIPPYPDYDPRGWSHEKQWKVSTAHPLKDGSVKEWEIEIPGAKEIAVYFDKISIPKDQIYITIERRGGEFSELISGEFEQYFSRPVSGDYLKIKISYDKKSKHYGFDISKVAFILKNRPLLLRIQKLDKMYQSDTISL